MKRGTKLTFSMILEAWRSRSNEDVLLKLKSQFPVRSYWLFAELNHGKYIKNGIRSSALNVLTQKGKKNLLRPKDVRLSVASYTPASTPDRLLDRDANTAGHVTRERVGEPTWVMVDFGEGNGKTVHSLAARPRPKYPDCFFRNADLLGSHGRKTWALVASIYQQELPRTGKWREWSSENVHSYRYYKLVLYDGYAGPDNR